MNYMYILHLVYEEHSTHSLPSQWMDQATPSLFGISEATSVVQNDAATPFSCGMDGTTPSPLLDYCKDKDGLSCLCNINIVL